MTETEKRTWVYPAGRHHPLRSPHWWHRWGWFAKVDSSSRVTVGGFALTRRGAQRRADRALRR